MTDSPGTINRISAKARPNTSVRASLPDALRDALSDPTMVAELCEHGARVSFIADAFCTEGGITALRHREFPAGGPSRGAPMSGETIADIATRFNRGEAEAAAARFLAAFTDATGAELDVVRIYTLRLIVRTSSP
jgi:hypothetical protein